MEASPAAESFPAKKGHLTVHWGSEAEAEFPSPKWETELGMEGFGDAQDMVGTWLCSCASGNLGRASLT